MRIAEKLYVEHYVSRLIHASANYYERAAPTVDRPSTFVAPASLVCPYIHSFPPVDSLFRIFILPQFAQIRFCNGVTSFFVSKRKAALKQSLFEQICLVLVCHRPSRIRHTA